MRLLQKNKALGTLKQKAFILIATEVANLVRKQNPETKYLML